MNAKVAAAEQLREATGRFLSSCTAATEAQWLFRPRPAAWSMSHVTEHVALANHNIHRVLGTRLLASPMGSNRTDVVDAEIPYLFYRGDEPPNVAPPTGAWTDRSAAAETLGASVLSILEWVADVGDDVDLRTVGIAHPVFGLRDGVQRVLFAAAHLERHRAQLIGLAHHADFPA